MDTPCQLCKKEGKPTPTQDFAIPGEKDGKLTTVAFVAVGFRLPGTPAGDVPILCNNCRQNLLSGLVVPNPASAQPEAPAQPS